MSKENNLNKIYEGIEYGNYWHSESQWLTDIREWEKQNKEADNE